MGRSLLLVEKKKGRLALLLLSFMTTLKSWYITAASWISGHLHVIAQLSCKKESYQNLLSCIFGSLRMRHNLPLMTELTIYSGECTVKIVYIAGRWCGNFKTVWPLLFLRILSAYQFSTHNIDDITHILFTIGVSDIQLTQLNPTFLCNVPLGLSFIMVTDMR